MKLLFLPIVILSAVATLSSTVCAHTAYNAIDGRSDSLDYLMERDPTLSTAYDQLASRTANHEDGLSLRAYIEDIVEEYIQRSINLNEAVEYLERRADNPVKWNPSEKPKPTTYGWGEGPLGPMGPKGGKKGRKGRRN